MRIPSRIDTLIQLEFKVKKVLGVEVALNLVSLVFKALILANLDQVNISLIVEVEIAVSPAELSLKFDLVFVSVPLSSVRVNIVLEFNRRSCKIS